MVTTKRVAAGMIRFSFLKTQLWLLLLRMDLKKARVVGGEGQVRRWLQSPRWEVVVVALTG